MQQHSRCLLEVPACQGRDPGPLCLLLHAWGRRKAVKPAKEQTGACHRAAVLLYPNSVRVDSSQWSKSKGIWSPPAQHGSLLAPSSIKSQLVREAPESSPSLGALSTMRLRVESPSVCCTTGEDQGPPFPHPSQCLLTSLQYPQGCLPKSLNPMSLSGNLLKENVLT